MADGINSAFKGLIKSVSNIPIYDLYSGDTQFASRTNIEYTEVFLVFFSPYKQVPS